MLQIPNRREPFGSFEDEIWDLFGICNLGFGISTLFGSGYAGLVMLDTFGYDYAARWSF